VLALRNHVTDVGDHYTELGAKTAEQLQGLLKAHQVSKTHYDAILKQQVALHRMAVGCVLSSSSPCCVICFVCVGGGKRGRGEGGLRCASTPPVGYIKLSCGGRAHTHTHTHIHTYTHTHIHTYTQMHTRTHARAHSHAYTHTHTRARVHARTHAHAHAHAHARTPLSRLSVR
jgi:hypothetical protein